MKDKRALAASKLGIKSEILPKSSPPSPRLRRTTFAWPANPSSREQLTSVSEGWCRGCGIVRLRATRFGAISSRSEKAIRNPHAPFGAQDFTAPNCGSLTWAVRVGTCHLSDVHVEGDSPGARRQSHQPFAERPYQSGGAPTLERDDYQPLPAHDRSTKAARSEKIRGEPSSPLHKQGRSVDTSKQPPRHGARRFASNLLATCCLRTPVVRR